MLIIHVKTQAHPATYKLDSDGHQASRLALAGRLEADTLSGIWADLVSEVRTSNAPDLTVDLQDVTYCDGTGIGLLVEIDAVMRARGGRVDFQNVSPDLRGILDKALLEHPLDTDARRPAHRSFIWQVGRSTAMVLDEVAAIIRFTGEMTAVLVWALTHPHRVRWRDALLAAEKSGANAVPVVSLLGFLVGLIISFQCVAPMRTFGAQSMVATVNAVAIVRELGPLMAAIILAGRSGSAFAAEIGTMKVTEELDALSTFGLDPTRFLVIPRVLAACIVTPLLSVFSTFMGIIGGWIVMWSLGYSLAFYIDAVTNAVDYVDFLQGTVKALVFALLVAGIGCLCGLRTRTGPQAVGDSTTQAVVIGIVLIVIADAALGTVFYYLGI